MDYGLSYNEIGYFRKFLLPQQGVQINIQKYTVHCPNFPLDRERALIAFVHSPYNLLEQLAE